MSRRLLVGAIAVLMLNTSAFAVDLTKIERKIKHEPEYRSSSPKYCLLVFGMKAEKRIWLVHDYDTLHFDRNSNGILGEPGEKVFTTYRSYIKVPNLLPQKPKGASNNLSLSISSSGYRVRFYGEHYQYVGFLKEPKAQFSKTPATAPIIHFNGPVVMKQYATPVTLQRGNTKGSYRNRSLRLMVGTPGLGTGTFAALHCKCRKKKGDLVATFRYPTGSPDTKLLQERVKLKTYG